MCVWAVAVSPVVFQCRLQKLVSPVASQCDAVLTKFLQWHSIVGQFQLSFSSGVPVYPASIRWVAQWYPSVHWVNHWHSSGIPVYTGPASVHWLRVRDVSHWLDASLESALDKYIAPSIYFCLKTPGILKNVSNFKTWLLSYKACSNSLFRVPARFTIFGVSNHGHYGAYLCI